MEETSLTNISEMDEVTITMPATIWAWMVAWHEVLNPVYIERQLRAKGYGSLVDAELDHEQEVRALSGRRKHVEGR